MNKMIDLYVSHMNNEGKSKTTITNTINFCEEFHRIVGKNVEEITVKDVDYYLDNLTERGNIQSTKRTKLAYVNNFMTFLEDRRIIDYNPCKTFRVKAPKAKIKTIETSKVKAMVDLAKKDYNSNVDLDAYPIMITLYSSGARIDKELMNLTEDDVLTDGIVVNGKGDKERFIPLPKETVKLLKDYIKKTRNRINTMSETEFSNKGGRNFKDYSTYRAKVDEVKDNRYVFVTEMGTKRTNNTVLSKLRKYAKRANVDFSEISAHKWRHTFATNLLDQDVPLDVISKLLGHESIVTTQIYAETRDERVKNSLKNVNFNL